MYQVKKLQAYILTFLFLLPSVGVHLDLTYCCGQLDNIGISHQAAVSVSDCCTISTGKSCDTNVELIMPQQLLDVATADALDFPALTINELPYLGFQHSMATAHRSVASPRTAEWRGPPSQALFQVFLC